MRDPPSGYAGRLSGLAEVRHFIGRGFLAVMRCRFTRAALVVMRIRP